MLSFPKALKAWGTPDFKETLKQEIERLEPDQLPMQQGLSISSHVADSGFSAMILSVSDDPGFIHAKAGIFYAGIIAGCSCADDPTPLSEQNEHCEVMFNIDKRTGEASAILLTD